MKTLAEALVNERKKKEITLEEISRKTNIKLNALEALERGDFERLPGKFYFKNYIKSYLKAIESDEAEFLQAYGETVNVIAFEEKDKPKVAYPKLKYSRFKKRGLLFTILIILIIIIVAYVAFHFYSGEKGFFSSFNLANLSEKKDKKWLIPATSIHVPSLKDKISQDQWPVRVNLEFEQNCWTQVYKGKEKIIEKVFTAGEKKVLAGYQIQIIVGNPAGVRMHINDREVTYLKKLARSEKMMINPSSVQDILNR